MSTAHHTAASVAGWVSRIVTSLFSGGALGKHALLRLARRCNICICTCIGINEGAIAAEPARRFAAPFVVVGKTPFHGVRDKATGEETGRVLLRVFGRYGLRFRRWSFDS